MINRFWTSSWNCSDPHNIWGSEGRRIDFIKLVRSLRTHIFRLPRSSRCVVAASVKPFNHWCPFLVTVSGLCRVHRLWGFSKKEFLQLEKVDEHLPSAFPNVPIRVVQFYISSYNNAVKGRNCAMYGFYIGIQGFDLIVKVFRGWCIYLPLSLSGSIPVSEFKYKLCYPG